MVVAVGSTAKGCDNACWAKVGVIELGCISHLGALDSDGHREGLCHACALCSNCAVLKWTTCVLVGLCPPSCWPQRSGLPVADINEAMAKT